MCCLQRSTVSFENPEYPVVSPRQAVRRPPRLRYHRSIIHVALVWSSGRFSFSFFSCGNFCHSAALGLPCVTTQINRVLHWHSNFSVSSVLPFQKQFAFSSVQCPMDPSPAQPRSVFDGLSLQRYVAFLVQNTHLICTDRNSLVHAITIKMLNCLTTPVDSSAKREVIRLLPSRIHHPNAASGDGTSAGIPTEGTDELLPEENRVCVAQRTGATRECCVCPMRCCRARKTRALKVPGGMRSRAPASSTDISS